MRYFFDSYAVIEIIKGNPIYVRYMQDEVVLTIFNLAEIYWSALNNLGEEAAEEIYTQYKASLTEINDEALKSAMKFRKQHKHKNFSYTDCIGYSIALQNNLKFLTGDKAFKGFDNVEFVQ